MSRIDLQEGGILIRDLLPGDARTLTDEEIAQGWDADIGKFEMRLAHQAQGKAIALAAEYEGHVAGYVNVYPNCAWGPFANRGYCEIVDFAVLAKYRRRGIGSKLMDVAEGIAATYAKVVYLGVGLHSGYGSAQRMYAKRGYVPDGSGVWYRNSVLAPYAECRNDDDLVLYLYKELG